MQCIVPQIVYFLPLLLYFIVRVIRFFTKWKYDFFCFYYDRLSPGNISLIHWNKIDHELLKLSWLTVAELIIHNHWSMKTQYIQHKLATASYFSCLILYKYSKLNYLTLYIFDTLFAFLVYMYIVIATQLFFWCVHHTCT